MSTAHSPTTHAVLIAGVSPQWLKTAAANGFLTEQRNDSEKIRQSVAQLTADLTLFQNTTFGTHFLNPDDPENWETFLTLLRSRKWNAISYGGGVRTIPKLGDYFTQLIHLAIQEQPTATLLFPLLPEDVVPVIKKYLPEAN